MVLTTIIEGLLVPKVEGTELVRYDYYDRDSLGYDVGKNGSEYEWTSVTASIESGFNPNNPFHYERSDMTRYAIRLAQLRKEKDYTTFDKARDAVISFGYRVDVGSDFVRLVSETDERVRARKSFKNGRKSN